MDGWDDPGKDHYPWYSNNFVLVESDELPPAPESVLYNDEYPDRIAELEAREVVLPDYSEVYQDEFAKEVKHQVRMALKSAGINIKEDGE